MARDFENMSDIEDLDDRELRDLVRSHLAAHNGLDIDDITVQVTEGKVTLTGRVGTDGERLVAEHVLTDVVGVSDFSNELFVDPNRRAESPEAIDEHLADESRHEGLLLGDRAVPISPEARGGRITRGRVVRHDRRASVDHGWNVVESAGESDAGRSARSR